jgi:hypothetical protein
MLTALIERYVEDKPDTGCLMWTGPLEKNGYARPRIGGHGKNAHRMFYEHYRGRIPDGLVLDHLCRNRACKRRQALLEEI